jgi:hypothetical protein
MGMAQAEWEHKCVIANNIMERAIDEIDLLFAATRVAHTNDEAAAETMHARQKQTEKESLERFSDWNSRREAELEHRFMGESNTTPWDVRETMRKVREGNVFKSKYKELRSQFDNAIHHKIKYPYRLNDTSMRENRRIKEYEERLDEEIRAHKVEKHALMWTETYFNTEVQLLGNWISVMTRLYVNMTELGIDTMQAQQYCEAFHQKITGIVSNMHVH